MREEPYSIHWSHETGCARPEGNCFLIGGDNRRVVLVEAGFKEADFIIRRAISTPPWSTQRWSRSGALLPVRSQPGACTIYTVSQALYFHLGMLAGVLHVKEDDQVCCRQVGGPGPAAVGEAA